MGTSELLQEEKLSHRLSYGQSWGFGRLICEVTLASMLVPELGKLTVTLVKTRNVFLIVEDSAEQKGHLLTAILLPPLDRSHAGRKRSREYNNFPC